MRRKEQPVALGSTGYITKTIHYMTNQALLRFQVVEFRLFFRVMRVDRLIGKKQFTKSNETPTKRT